MAGREFSGSRSSGASHGCEEVGAQPNVRCKITRISKKNVEKVGLDDVFGSIIFSICLKVAYFAWTFLFAGAAF